jgi:VWFA-related protein
MFTAAAALSAVIVLGQDHNVAATQETPIFKSGVALVKVDVEVTDGTKLLGGFQKDDFRILDNGTEQPILYFSQSEEPLDVILLFDLSGSMMSKLKKLSEAAHAALAELRNGDRVSVMVFGSKSRVVLPFTEDLNAVEMAINGVTAMRMGGTRILAAINDAAMLFMKEQRTQRRRALIAVTDNHGQISGRKSATVRNLWEADAVLSGLQVRRPGETALRPRPGAAARRSCAERVAINAAANDGHSVAGVAGSPATEPVGFRCEIDEAVW